MYRCRVSLCTAFLSRGTNSYSYSWDREGLIYDEWMIAVVRSPLISEVSTPEWRVTIHYECKPRTKSSNRHCGIKFCRFVVTTPLLISSVVMSFPVIASTLLCLFVPSFSLWFVVVSFCFLSVPFRLVINRFAYEPSWPGNYTYLWQPSSSIQHHMS